MPKVSVTIITSNEAANIAAALASVAWADEIIVVDSHSRDETAAIARQYTPNVIVRDWPGYGEQKNYAASLAQHDWILSLDADERVTAPLADEIRRLLNSDPECRGYRIPRVSHHLGQWIRSTDWYPDYQLRLYDRRHATWKTQPVHESVTVEGRVGELRGELEHFPYRTISDHLQTMDRYTTLAAQHLFEQGRRAGLIDIVAHPPLAFCRNYLLRGGIRDGMPGLIVSAMNAGYVLLKFAKLYELQRAAPRRSS